MKNKIADLNNHLFAQLERLNEEGLSEKQIKAEVMRSKAVVDVAGQVIELAKTVVEAERIKHSCQLQSSPVELLSNG